MAKVNALSHSFNRGVVSPKALARVDIEKLRMAAETQTNWLPSVLGPMTIRPGWQYVSTTRLNRAMYPLRFVFSNSDWAILELTTGAMQVRLADESLVSFSSVSTTVTNGDFNSSSGWTLTAGGSSTSVITGGNLVLTGASTSGTAKGGRLVSVASGDRNVRHCLKIIVSGGPVTFRAGDGAGDDSYITSTSLDTGTHFLELTPPGDFYVQFESAALPSRTIASIEVYTGTLVLDTQWTLADLPYLRYAQSADVVFVACYGLPTKRIERRSTRSWSIVDYKTDDGPFLASFDDTITITPSGLSGNVTLTASRSLFRAEHVGALFRLFHQGQVVSGSVSALNDTTSAIRVTGVGTARAFQYAVTGSFTATLTLQRSFDSATTGFVDTTTTATGAASGTVTDGFDNSIVWYRWKVTAYTSGTPGYSLTFPGGGGAGVCRVTTFNSATSVAVEVLSPFFNTTASQDWREGAWSGYQGYPSAVALHEGRLFWASGDHIWGSVSDAYTSFDYEATGDSAPIDRSIGYGPVDTINWLLSLNRMVIGREGSEITARSSSLDEPLTPTNFNLKDAATLGSARLPAVKVDTRGIFVQQGYRRIYDLAFTPQAADYTARELTRLAPEICSSDVVAIGVQRMPNTRLHFVLSDGTAAVLVYDLDDDVVAWWKVETDGDIENVVVMPGAPDDKVYYIVKRVINGSTVRYIERWAREDQCSGLPDARLADAHLIYSGSATTTISGLSHLEGEEVVVWGYTSGATTGRDLGTYTVSAGAITGLSASVVWACVGLAYTATFVSAKLAYGARMGTAINQHKRIARLGLVLHNTHYQGIRYGQDADYLDQLPLYEEGTETPSDTVWTGYDQQMFALNGTWGTDARLHLTAAAPRPATVLAAVSMIETHEG